MKIRAGYVSNSSTSSFCIVGVKCGELYFNADMKHLRLKLEGIGFEKADVDRMGLPELLLNLYHCLFGKAYRDIFGDIEVVSGISEYNGDVIMGFDITRMNDDETLAQFKERVFGQLQRMGYLGIARDMGIFIDGGMI